MILAQRIAGTFLCPKRTIGHTSSRFQRSRMARCSRATTRSWRTSAATRFLPPKMPSAVWERMGQARPRRLAAARQSSFHGRCQPRAQYRRRCKRRPIFPRDWRRHRKQDDEAPRDHHPRSQRLVGRAANGFAELRLARPATWRAWQREQGDEGLSALKLSGCVRVCSPRASLQPPTTRWPR